MVRSSPVRVVRRPISRQRRRLDDCRSGNPLPARLDPGIGARLMALGCAPVWATTWMEKANEAVAPASACRGYPWVRGPDAGAGEGPRGLHRKTRPLVEWAAGRPFIRVDDEISGVDRQQVTASHPGLSLLHRVDPAKGLTDADFSTLADWLRAVARGRGFPAARKALTG